MTMTSRVSLTLAICVLAGVATLVGLARSGPEAAAPAAATAAPAAQTETTTAQPVGGSTITIDNFAFESGVSAVAGSTLSVTNADGAPHTLTARDGEFDTGLLGSGESGDITLPSTPGTYAFFCELHPSMTGTVTVE